MDTTHINRRTFVKTSLATGAAMALPGCLLKAQGTPEVKDKTGVQEKPNILFIITDEQHWKMMSCMGNKDLKTPAMDSLAAGGVRFENTYCTNPICVPSRFSMFTGHMPSEIGMYRNGALDDCDEAKRYSGEGPDNYSVWMKRGMGWLLRSAGYETMYAGKEHLILEDSGSADGACPARKRRAAEAKAKGLDYPERASVRYGFDALNVGEAGGICSAFDKFARMPRQKPYAFVASFINPHDIGYMALQDQKFKMGEITSKEQLEKYNLNGKKNMPFLDSFDPNNLPPLPDNFAIPPDEPLGLAEKGINRLAVGYARANWSENKWRIHRWLYCRYTEMVDELIGKLLKTLKDAGQEENTVIIFTSDHGDMDGAHHLEHKELLYEESVRIPFIISQKGKTAAGTADKSHLVQSGLDIIPTMCDYAGIEAPKDLIGHSVRPLAEGREVKNWRDHIVIESPYGRTVRTARYKYNIYDRVTDDPKEIREQLTDLEKDPGEMKNLAVDPANAETLNAHRELLKGIR